MSSSTPSSSAFPTFTMGLKTYKVSMKLHADNRAKLCDMLLQRTRCHHQNNNESSYGGGGGHHHNCRDDIIYLEGGEEQQRNDTDHEPIFRQESYFHYLFGVKEPGFAGCIDVKTGRTTLFMPRLPPSYATIMGRIKTCEEFRDMYGVDDVRYRDEVEEYLGGLLEERRRKGAGREKDDIMDNDDDGGDEEKKASSTSSSSDGDNEDGCSSPSHDATVLLLRGTNSDSGNTYMPPTLKLNCCNKTTEDNNDSSSSPRPSPLTDTTILFPVLAECRVIKSHDELSLLRHVSNLTSEGHVEMMRRCQPSLSEYQLEAIFRYYTYYHYGCRNVGYTPICGCGPNSAVLHYGHAGAPNDYTLRDGDLCLLDCGTEYHCYGSDITCSFPVNGKFTKDQRGVYEGVLQAQKDVIQMLKPGVSWVDCHLAAERAILSALVQLGVITTRNASTGVETTLDDLVTKRVGAVFMPHGLGHFIGIDTHDVGGYLPTHPPRSTLPGLKSLRTARVMKAGMVITVEPGCYFIHHLLNEALEDGNELREYINEERLRNDFWTMGGIRLEDVVHVTDDGGCDNFTNCPRTVREVEGVMGGTLKWPPLVDDAPELKRSRLTAHHG